MLVSDDYVTQRAEHVLRCGHTAPSAFAAAGPTRTMEQSSIAPYRGRLIVQYIPAVAKDIFVWIAGARCSVNYFNRAI